MKHVERLTEINCETLHLVGCTLRTGKKVTNYFSRQTIGEDIAWGSRHRWKDNIEMFIMETEHA